jgi:hypothetical protein
MIVELKKIIDCLGIGSEECTKKALTALGDNAGFNLSAKSENDTVNGSVTIVHDAPPLHHLITVEIYEVFSRPDPNPGGRKSTLARPEVFPSKQTIVNSISKLTTQPEQ